MRKISQPKYGMTDVLERCLRHIANTDLVIRAENSRAALATAETNYSYEADRQRLYTIAESDRIGQLFKVDTDKLYEKLSSITPETREIYDHIMGLARGSICPLCNQRVVSTLDHYLSKSLHPGLAITPLNLVPACKDCNTDSGVRRATSPGHQTVHPYFDMVDDEVWLHAELLPASPPGIRFRVKKPGSWSSDKFQSVETHFGSFGLAELYAAQAGQELVNIYFDLVNSDLLFEAEQRSKHLIETSRRRRRPVKNSWQAALYEAAGNSEWFCDDGYLEISHSELFIE